MKLKQIFFAIVFCWCLMCLCIRCYMNLSGFQTGRTAGKGNVELNGSYNWTKNSPVFYASDEELDDYELRNSKDFDFDLKAGVSDKLDLGFHIGTTRLGVDAKYRLGKNDGLFGLAFGMSGGITGGRGSYLQLPVFFSVHPHEYITIYNAPRYIIHFFEEGSSTYNTSRLHFLGSNTGLFFGKNIQFGIDYGVYSMAAGKHSFRLQNFGLGMKISFGKGNE